MPRSTPTAGGRRERTSTMGRRSKLTRALIDQICETLARGAYRQDTAVACGIGRSTFFRWMEHGEADVEHDRATLHAELWQRVQQAESEAKVKLCGMIVAAAPEDWKAAAWMLERKHPDEFGRRDRLDVNTPPPRAMDLRGLSDDDLDVLDEISARATGVAAEGAAGP